MIRTPLHSGARMQLILKYANVINTSPAVLWDGAFDSLRALETTPEDWECVSRVLQKSVVWL